MSIDGNQDHLSDLLKEKISALVDDELVMEEKMALLAKLNEDENLRDAWKNYYLIKSIMQSGDNPLLKQSHQIAARVKSELNQESSHSLSDSVIITAKGKNSASEQSSQG